MKRTEIINIIAKLIGAQSYLEIGVRNPTDNYTGVNVANKTGVDPRAINADIAQCTSDAFFAGDVGQFDLIFIDGDHTAKQVAKDVDNAFKALAPGGVIVMHDCLPISASEGAPTKPSKHAAWCGEAWRAFARYRGLKSYHAAVVDADHAGDRR